MNTRRELISGLLAALVSIVLVSGSLTISFAESQTEISGAPATPTDAPTATLIIPSLAPGEPTLTPSHTPKEPSPTAVSPTPSCSYPPDWMAVMITPGDTLESLAEAYQTTVAEISEANCLMIETLVPGTILYVPQPVASLTPTKSATPRPSPIPCSGPPASWVQYIVQPGDTLYSLGRAFGVTARQLQNANCMGSSTTIRAGKPIYVPNVPTKTTIPSHTPTPSITPSPTQTHTPTETSIVPPTDTPTATLTPPPITETLVTPSATPTETTPPTSTDTLTPEPSPTVTDTG